MSSKSNPSKYNSKKTTTVILSIALGILVLVSGISLINLSDLSSQNDKLKADIKATPKGINLDSFIDKSAPPEYKAAYLFARENVSVLKGINCYCGCQSKNYGHTSLASCFIEKISDDGVIEYSDHGKNCQLCVNEAISTKKWLEEGKGYKEISKLIDEKYKPKN